MKVHFLVKVLLLQVSRAVDALVHLLHVIAKRKGLALSEVQDPADAVGGFR